MSASNEPQQLTLALAVELLDRAVQEKGADYVYAKNKGIPACVYARDGEPSCIVGHVLAYAGHPVSKMASLDGASSTCADALSRLPEWNVTAEAAAVLFVAQAEQDSGVPWGEAVEAARVVAKVGKPQWQVVP